jgi:hypothetical protein
MVHVAKRPATHDAALLRPKRYPVREPWGCLALPRTGLTGLSGHREKAAQRGRGGEQALDRPGCGIQFAFGAGQRRAARMPARVLHRRLAWRPRNGQAGGLPLGVAGFQPPGAKAVTP